MSTKATKTTKITEPDDGEDELGFTDLVEMEDGSIVWVTDPPRDDCPYGVFEAMLVEPPANPHPRARKIEIGDVDKYPISAVADWVLRH